jgi:hypothetical protein
MVAVRHGHLSSSVNPRCAYGKNNVGIAQLLADEYMNRTKITRQTPRLHARFENTQSIFQIG